MHPSQNRPRHVAVEKAPPVIETKASEFQEAVADEHSPSDSPDASDSESPSKSEGEQHEDAGSAAFNPETGEINWDCPCLGGMAHGPCGEEFRTAFSCFVYSEGEPKGIECVEKFKGMQVSYSRPLASMYTTNHVCLRNEGLLQGSSRALWSG